MNLPLQRIRMLIVDDDPQFRKTAAWFLSTEPQFDVIAAVSTITEMQTAVIQEQPDLILIDLQLVLTNSPQFEDYIKRMMPVPKVILMSIFDTEQCRQHAHVYGANNCVAKVQFGDEVGELIQLLFPN
jgi:DNA-binding NarL/FixJ family response regulator